MTHVPLDLLDRIRRLEGEVRSLRGRAQMRPAMDQVHSGEVSIGEGGTLAVYPPGQHSAVFAVGEWTSEETGPAYGTALRRVDGSQALAVGGNAAGAHQMVRVTSAGGEVIVCDDPYAPDYLGRPWVPIPMHPPVEVTASDWRSRLVGRLWTQHAVLFVRYSVYAPAGTTCEARLRLEGPDGPRQLGDTISASGDAETLASERIARADHGMAYGAVGLLRLEARRTAGTAPGTVWCHGMWGTTTLTEAEAA